jgi:hypothetical protein
LTENSGHRLVVIFVREFACVSRIQIHSVANPVSPRNKGIMKRGQHEVP